MSLGGLEFLPNPCARLDTRLHPGLDLGLDPGVGFSLECKCNVPNRRQGIISMLRVGRWADFASRAEPRQEVEVETQEWRLGAIPVSPSFPVFWAPIRLPSESGRSDHLPSGGSQKYRLCLAQPCYGLVKRPHGRLSNRC